MSQFFQQFPVVFQSLNVGFLQTLKLFICTLLGALLGISTAQYNKEVNVKYGPATWDDVENEDDEE